MRDFKGMKRQRGRNRSGGAPPTGKPQQNANRAFDSSGPENIKVRGHAQSVYEKYQQLARDAFSSGDRVLAESHLQHAEHYFRLLRLIQPNRPTAEIVARDVFASGFDIDFEDEGGTQFAPEPEAQGGGSAGAEGVQPTSDVADASGDQGRDRPRFDDRGRGQDRYQGERQQGERVQGDRYQGDRDRNYADRPQSDRYPTERPQGERNQGDRYQGGGRNQGDRYERGQGDRVQGERAQNERQQGDRFQADRVQNDRYQGERPQNERPQGERQDRPRRDGRDRNREGGEARGDRPFEARDSRGDRQSRLETRPEGDRTEAERFETGNPYPEAVITEAPAHAAPEASAAEVGSPRLRSEDGGFSEAPAFLQAMMPVSAPTLSDASEAEEAPARRVRRPRRRAEAVDSAPAEDNPPPSAAVASEDA